MNDFSVFNEIINKYAQDTSTDVNVIPEETQIGQSVYDESDSEYVIIEDDANTTNKVVMPKDQMGVAVPQGVKTVEDTELSSQYTVQPNSQVLSSKAKERALSSNKTSGGTKVLKKHSKDKERAADGVLDVFQKSDKYPVLPEFMKQAQAQKGLDESGPDSIENKLKNLGFGIVETGGGCTAWWLFNKDKNFDVYISADGCSHIFDEEAFGDDNEVVGGTYEPDGTDIIEEHYFYSEKDLFDWIDTVIQKDIK